jgi:hypothetical protein
LVLQSLYFQCIWWRLLQKPVVCLSLIFTFLLCMLYLNLFKLSTNIHVNSDHFLSRFTNTKYSFFDLSLGRRGGSLISHLPSYWVVVPNNFSFITIRWADVFAMNINSKRLLHNIFHIGHGISTRLPCQARERSSVAYMGRGLIPGTIWKISCHNLFFTYFTLTFFKHLLLYCSKDLWTDKSRK